MLPDPSSPLRLIGARESTDELIAVATGQLASGALCFVMAVAGYYYLDKTSSVEPTPPRVLPTVYGASAPGRWVLSESGFDTPAVSGNIYVSAHALDGHQDGSELFPFGDIDQALELAATMDAAVIWIGAGEFELASATQHLVPSNTQLRGEGIGVTVINLAVPYANQAYGFRCLNVDNVLFQDFTLDGHVDEQSYSMADNGQIAIGVTQGSTNVRVSNVLVKNMSKDCVYVSGATDTIVEYSTLQNFSRGGVTTVDCDGLIVRGSKVQFGRDLPVVIGNNGVWLEPNNGSAVFRGIQIYGNTFRSLARGVFLLNAQQVEAEVVEHDNVYDDCATNGIYALSIPEGSFTSSTYRSSGTLATADPERAALYVASSPNVALESNLFTSCSGEFASLVVGNQCPAALVRNNRFYGDLKSAIRVQYVFGGSTRRTVTGNVAFGGSQAAPGTSPAFQVIGISAHPIDSDIIEYNTVDTGAASYARFLECDWFSGGSTAPNTVFGTGAGAAITNGTPGIVVAGQTYAVRYSDRIVHSQPGTDVARAYSLPLNPVPGQRHLIKDSKGDAATRNITVTPLAGTINGAPNVVISQNYGAVEVYYGTTEWLLA